jgi:hypothetical protein
VDDRQHPVCVNLCIPQVVAEGSSGGQWSLPRPKELKPGQFAAALYRSRSSAEPVKEKNWMPFVWGDALMTVHSVVPHRVFRCAGAGAEHIYASSYMPLLLVVVAMVSDEHAAQQHPYLRTSMRAPPTLQHPEY